MATQPTQDAVPSESPRDLKFNAGKIDEFVTSSGWTYTDRFGNKHYTIEGINYLAQQVMNSFGYVTLTGVSFTTGATITKPNEVLFNEANNEYYKWTGSFSSGPKIVPANSTPDSTGGIGAGKWLSVGDSTLRGDLAAPAGVSLVGGAAKKAGEDFTGPVSMPAITVKSTTGNVIIGDVPVGVPGAIWPNPDSLRDAVNVSRNLADTPLNCHAFADKTLINGASAVTGYGAFDSTLIIYGAHKQDHAHSFQDRISYQGTNRIDNQYGYFSQPTISGSGTMGDRRGIFINDVAITGGGKLEQQTGVYLEDLKAASGINVAFQTRQTTGYTFYAPNNAKMFHNGPVGFGYDPVDGDTNFALHFRGSEPATPYYGFLHTDNSGTAMGASSDVAINFIQGGAVRAKIKPQASTLSAFTPGDDNHTPLGDIANRWSVVVAGTGAINTSDARKKTTPITLEKLSKNITSNEDAILDAWGDVSVIAFKWLQSIDEKGEVAARWHIGVIAQQVRDAFHNRGIDATTFGLLCHDKWDQITEVVDGKIFVVKEAGDIWSIRPDQCAWLEAAYQRRVNSSLIERIERLEKIIVKN